MFSDGLPPRSGKILFITGIDTGIGKTVATAYLAARLMRLGHSVITAKAVQTGCVGLSEDIAAHRRLQKLPLLPEDRDGTTCPYLFAYPCSPHLAARMEGKTIDPAAIARAAATLAVRYDYVLLEGAGGLAVPLNDEETTLDLVRRQGWPVVIVTSGRLGSISHTLLTLEACRSSGIAVETLVFNRFPPGDPAIAGETAAYLQNYLQKHFPDAAFEILDQAGDAP
ncbi:ATP-dependent dethiobiotin synthetase BioD 1 [Kingella potus]|uniref:ATP-dependent dethiobiotin synthetase BioD n=1 Tax=Kingella potus TaxID=265175 RepID=A0A377R0R0_9NEIS|nr:dethiobiotin synthase [Kingella potus]UOP00471.1 dethiobiotin synthase [Kingella potus]STR02460.1 ATP-dependent dethiobiotin synthetase BioD 1 [Kingella potus]